MSLPEATWAVCPGIKSEGIRAHYMRDACSSCGPWWEVFPRCPYCKKKVTQTGYGRRKCRNKECGQYFVVPTSVPEWNELI
jgi:hypothetical protein